MGIIGKPLGIALALIAVAVMGHFVFSSFYRDAIENESIWQVLNWFMAFGIIVALITNCIAKRTAAADSGDASARVLTSAAFYAAAALALLFFWNWFNELVVGAGNESQVRGAFWVIINTLFVLVMVSASARLWTAD